jgi:L-lactate dehydrogenase complex protein LldG
LQLLDALEAAAAPINLRILKAASGADAQKHIVEIASNRTPEWGGDKKVCAWRHPRIERLELAAALERCRIPLVTDDTAGDRRPGTEDADGRKAFVRNVSESFIGITAADYCVAESATLVMRTGSGQARSVSLVPTIHVAVIALGQIVADFKELYASLRWGDNGGPFDLTTCLTFVSGPSKTADIEATMVDGAHGPREVYLIVLLDEDVG